MDEENIKKIKAKLNEQFGTRPIERLQIAEEHLAEVITIGVDDCPLKEYKSDMLMRALDTALDNLEIDKSLFIKGWSKPVEDQLMIEAAGDILRKFSEGGITKITGLAAGLSCILDKTFDRDLIKVVIKLMNCYYNEEVK